MSDPLRNIWAGAVDRGFERGYVRGRIGRANADGSITVNVPDRPNYVYVTLTGDGTQTVSIALNLGTARMVDLPVKMRRVNGMLVIKEVDDSMLASFLAGGVGGSVASHTHHTGSGLEYEIEALRLEPGRVRYSGGLLVYINWFRYYHDGAWVRWPGGTFDLASYLPSTADKWAWVLVGIDPATNAPMAVTGAEYDNQADLADTLIEDIDFGAGNPCAAIQTQEGDTTLSSFSRYRDAHGWLGQGGNRAEGILYVTSAQTGNVGTGEDTLGTYTVAAGQLAADGDSLWFEAAGTFATSVNTKDLRVHFGASGTTLVFDTGALAITAASVWVLRGRIVRAGASAQKGYASLDTDSATLSAFAGLEAGLDQTLSGALDLAITGEGTDDGDVVLESLTIGFDPFNG